MPVLHRREAKRFILPGVLFIPDPDEGSLQQVHHRGAGPQGDRLASAGGDCHVTVWDVASAKPTPLLCNDRSAVLAVACTHLPDGRTLAVTGSWDATDGWRVACALLTVAIAAPLFQAWRDASGHAAGQRSLSDRIPYIAAHNHAWTNIVLWCAACVFVGITVGTREARTDSAAPASTPHSSCSPSVWT